MAKKKEITGLTYQKYTSLFQGLRKKGLSTKKFTKLLSTLSSLAQQIKIVLTQHICQKSYFHATSDIKQTTTTSIIVFNNWNARYKDIC